MEVYTMDLKRRGKNGAHENLFGSSPTDNPVWRGDVWRTLRVEREETPE